MERAEKLARRAAKAESRAARRAAPPPLPEDRVAARNEKLARRAAKVEARERRRSPSKVNVKQAERDDAEALGRLMLFRLAALRRSPIVAERAARQLALTPFEARASDGDKVVSAGITWTVPRTTEGDSFGAKIRGGWLPLPEIVRTRPYAQGRVMLDIGANIGLTSILRAVAGDFETVFCAEPVGTNFAALCEAVQENGLAGVVVPQQLAIGESEGVVTLDLEDGIGLPHVTAVDAKPQANAVQARVTTLDGWISDLGLDLADISFIKSDAQGYEGHILRGAQAVLSHKHIVWQIEYWPAGMRMHGTSVEEVMDILAEHFSHFIDAKRIKWFGSTPMPTARLTEVLADVNESPNTFTDLVLLNL